MFSFSLVSWWVLSQEWSQGLVSACDFLLELLQLCSSVWLVAVGCAVDPSRFIFSLQIILLVSQYKLVDHRVEIKIIQLLLNWMHPLVESLQILEHYLIHHGQLLEQLLVRELGLKLQLSPQPAPWAHYRLDLAELYVDHRLVPILHGHDQITVFEVPPCWTFDF